MGSDKLCVSAGVGNFHLNPNSCNNNNKTKEM